MTDLTEKTLATERKYTGKIISVDLLDIELPDGRKAVWALAHIYIHEEVPA